MKNRKLMILLTIVVVLLLLLSFAGYLTVNSGKYIFVKSLERTSYNLIPNTGKTVNMLIPNNYKKQDKLYLNMDVKSSYENNISSNNIEFYYDKGDFYLKDNNKKTLIELLGKEDRIYFKIKDALKTFYYFESEKQKNKNINSYSNTIIKYLNSSINEELDKDDFTKSKENIKINDISYKTTKVTLNLNEKLLNNIVINFLNKIKNDSELLEYFANTLNYEKEECISLINETINNLKDEKGNDELLKYSIYVKNNQTLRHEIKDEETIYILEDSYIKNKRYINFNIESNDEKVVEAKIKKEGNSGEINIDINNSLKLNGEYEKNNDSSTINFDIKDSNDISIGNILYEFKANDNQDEINLNLVINNLYNLNAKGIINFDKEMPKIDTSGAKYYETMTDEEQEKIIYSLLGI